MSPAVSFGEGLVFGVEGTGPITVVAGIAGGGSAADDEDPPTRVAVAGALDSSYDDDEESVASAGSAVARPSTGSTTRTVFVHRK